MRFMLLFGDAVFVHIFGIVAIIVDITEFVGLLVEHVWFSYSWESCIY